MLRLNVRKLSLAECYKLKDWGPYRNKYVDTAALSESIRDGHEDVFVLTDDNGDLKGMVRVSYRVSIFGMKIYKDAVQLFDVYADDTYLEESLMARCIQLLVKDNHTHQFLTQFDVSEEQLQRFQNAGFVNVVGHLNVFEDGIVGGSELTVLMNNGDMIA